MMMTIMIYVYIEVKIEKNNWFFSNPVDSCLKINIVGSRTNSQSIFFFIIYSEGLSFHKIMITYKITI